MKVTGRQRDNASDQGSKEKVEGRTTALSKIETAAEAGSSGQKSPSAKNSQIFLHLAAAQFLISAIRSKLPARDYLHTKVGLTTHIIRPDLLSVSSTTLSQTEGEQLNNESTDE